MTREGKTVNQRRTSLRKKWEKIQVSSRNYVDNQLGRSERRGFFAAGICPFMAVHNPKTGKFELSVLLVKERRNKSIKLNFLGGKREMGETPDETAYREFLEETGYLLMTKQKQRLLRLLKADKNHVMWLSQGRYILIGISSPKEWADLPEMFESWRTRMQKTTDKNKRSKSQEKDKFKTHSLIWVPVKKLPKIKDQMSRFFISICRFQQFEEFLNTYSENTEEVEILKHFHSKLWNSSKVQKRGRDVRIYHRPKKRVRR